MNVQCYFLESEIQQNQKMGIVGFYCLVSVRNFINIVVYHFHQI